MESRKNILICPLEWGLGHASRMIPVADELISRGHNVIFAAGEELLKFADSELPGCKKVKFPGFRPQYSGRLPQYISVLLHMPVLIYEIVREHRRLEKIIQEHSVDIVISDNRFGLWNKKVRTAYITHQLRIPFPGIFRFLEPAGLLLHRYIIRKYDFCLIPDLPGDKNLSGRLSHSTKLPGNERYIGILSRFSGISINDNPEKTAHRIVALLSGPEPQRSILEKKLSAVLNENSRCGIILRGLPGKEASVFRSGNIDYYNHLPPEEFKNLVLSASAIICRSGYSTIMDLTALGRSALLIPTPGQTEQEYLAEYLSQKGLFSCISQKKLDKDLPFESVRNYNSSEILNLSRQLLRSVLDELSDEPHKQAQSSKTS